MIQSVLSFVSGVGEWLQGLLIGDYFLINSFLGACLLKFFIFQESFCIDYLFFLRSFITWMRNSIGPLELLLSHRFSNQYSNLNSLRNRFFSGFYLSPQSALEGGLLDLTCFPLDLCQEWSGWTKWLYSFQHLFNLYHLVSAQDVWDPWQFCWWSWHLQ